MSDVICDMEDCRHNNEDGGCDRWRIELDEDGTCIDYERGKDED